jgi:DNA polymerase III epsilon subunit-like protein
MKILAFDTETTGLPLGRNPSIRDTGKWPYIVQFSYILYDSETHNIIDMMNEIIYIGDDVYISEKSIEIHKITREICKNEGIHIEDALNRFKKTMLNSDIIIAHNLQFDKNVILVESLRNNIKPVFKSAILNKPEEYCTMKNNIDLCKIERINKIGEKYYKYPRLSELYQHIFNIEPNGLHNSLVDVLLCLRSYMKLNNNVDILIDESISNMFTKYRIHYDN